MKKTVAVFAIILGFNVIITGSEAAELSDDTQFDAYYLQQTQLLNEEVTDKYSNTMKIPDRNDFSQRLGAYIANTSGLGQDYGNYVADLICQYSTDYNVDPMLAASLFEQESSFRMDTISSAGAIGIAQLMPETAAGMGYDPYCLEENIKGGIEYLSYQMNRFCDAGNLQASFAIASYNAGPRAVVNYGDVPPYAETRNHVTAVAHNYDNLANL